MQQESICSTNCLVPTLENCKNVSWIYFSFSDRKWGVYNYKERITVLHFLSFNLFSLIIQFHKFVCLQGIFALLAQSMLLCLHEFWNLDTTNIKTYCVFDTFSLIRVCQSKIWLYIWSWLDAWADKYACLQICCDWT